jgi:site-specific DNA-methyltransferase (cytosine-N4-specific)
VSAYYADDWLTIYQGDVRAVLPELASDGVDCIVTSPPYWGLRDYGTATWEGGDAECDHVEKQARNDMTPERLAERAAQYGTGQQAGSLVKPIQHKGLCPKCGAVRQDSQIGLERTPEEYVANLVAVFRELRRVLKPSGTCWLNLGDSYATSPKGNPGALSNGLTNMGRNAATANAHRSQRSTIVGGLKPKDLVGIPWRVAFALQADGWFLRSDIIWAKPNPMPESVTDRPTKAHEYLFLLTKSARYYYDAAAVAEQAQLWSGRAADFSREGNPVADHIIPGQSAAQHRPRTNGKHSATDPQAAGRRIVENVKAARAQGADHDSPFGPTRNLRSVWTIATRPYPGAHFAVFPPELPERCIKAGSAELGVVLDPFAGSGTTGMVANRLSRRAILIDLNGDYLKQQLKRNAQTPLGLAG